MLFEWLHNEHIAYFYSFNNSFQDAFIKITQREGVVSLWSGLSPTLILAIPSTVVYFVTYEQLRVKINDSVNFRRNKRKNITSDWANYKQPFWVIKIIFISEKNFNI